MCKEPGYSCYKLPFGSSNFSFNLSLHDSFSIGIIKFSSVEKKMKRKKKMERQNFRKSIERIWLDDIKEMRKSKARK